MVTSWGNASRAITGGAGLDIPLEPVAITAEQAEQRRQRQIAAIEAAEAAASAAAERTPLSRRRRKNDAMSLPVSVPRPAPEPPPAVAVPSPRRDNPPQEETVRQLTADLATATEQVTALRSRVREQEASLAEQATALSQARSQLVEAHTEAQAGTARSETDTATIRQLRYELAMAGQRITSLRTQASEQGTCLQDLWTDLDQAHAELAKVRAQVQTTTARAETAEAALAGIRQRIQTALTGDLPTAPPAEPDHDAEPEQGEGEPVMCEGGCGIPVDPAYVKRTKRRWHGGHCADLAAAAAADRSPGRRAVA
jgi:hypothetical protein